MAATGYRPLTRRDLAEEEYRLDQVRGRRYCRVHPQQQMIPLLRGVDVCPACPPEGERQRPSDAERRPDHSHPSKGQVVETPGTQPPGEEGNTL